MEQGPEASQSPRRQLLAFEEKPASGAEKKGNPGEAGEEMSAEGTALIEIALPDRKRQSRRKESVRLPRALLDRPKRKGHGLRPWPGKE